MCSAYLFCLQFETVGIRQEWSLLLMADKNCLQNHQASGRESLDQQAPHTMGLALVPPLLQDAFSLLYHSGAQQVYWLQAYILPEGLFSLCCFLTLAILTCVLKHGFHFNILSRCPSKPTSYYISICLLGERCFSWRKE